MTKHMGRAMLPAPIQNPIAVLAFEPRPALVSQVPNAPALVRGAWTVVMRQVLKLKIDKASSKLAFGIKNGELEAAIDLFREKEIAPAAWLAWRAGVLFSGASYPVSLGVLLGVRWLDMQGKRWTFRSQTAGVFGGRAVVVGEPPVHGIGNTLAETAYRTHALEQKAVLEANWRKATHYGALFANVDIATAFVEHAKRRDLGGDK